MQNQKTKARYIKPPNKIKQKVGGGGLPPNVLEKSQLAIENTDVDFTPYAENYLKSLNQVLERYGRHEIDEYDALKELVAPVMQLKASGGMFGYQLISEIADIILLLLDNIKRLNDDVLQIVLAHQNSIQIIVTTRLKGDGGREGSLLVAELGNACERFYKKYDIVPE